MEALATNERLAGLIRVFKVTRHGRAEHNQTKKLLKGGCLNLQRTILAGTGGIHQYLSKPVQVILSIFTRRQVGNFLSNRRHSRRILAKGE
jgi:hypothetical protein